ncbi:MAG: ABC transporter ATP-binding protein [Verrucomicrobiota bacterium]
MSEFVLQYENLNVCYGLNESSDFALRDFSLEVSRGEVFALVGESGSGKSTAGFAAGGLLQSNNTEVSGRIAVAGRSIPADDFATLRKNCGVKIGFVFQEPASALHPTIRIKTQVAEAIQPRRSREETDLRVAQLLESVQLDPEKRILGSYPHHLSGGMQQRIVLAMAIANSPPVLIADEPTTALDPTIRKEVLELIRNQASENARSVLLITHDLGVVSHYSDRMAVLKKGQIVESGDTKRVLANPQHEYTRELIASAL